MPAPKYLPHVLYSTVLTSVSIHLLWQRRASEDDRARKNAQITILEDLARQLRSGAPITDEEVDRLRNLARVHGVQGSGEDMAEGHGVPERKVQWADVLWGRKWSDQEGSDEWEQKDLEQIRTEFSKAAS
ncbi:hypothetical protein ID866_9597 [Astraeus odoratus]|nr:hypothetical protein ID866_9597 [Astraeus odoratus]